jgi:hypothetical protein
MTLPPAANAAVGQEERAMWVLVALPPEVPGDLDLTNELVVLVVDAHRATVAEVGARRRLLRVGWVARRAVVVAAEGRDDGHQPGLRVRQELRAARQRVGAHLG